MSLELLEENDPQLLVVSEPWDFESDGSPAQLILYMKEVMARHSGIGLSAIQCGVKKRILIMGTIDNFTVCINPAIISISEERVSDQEGCLSFPDLWMKVKRPAGVSIKYQNINGEEVEDTLLGLRARVFLHEYDHLLGITFDQRVGKLTLKMAKEKRKKELKKVRA